MANDFRSQLDAARRRLHDRLAVSTLCYPDGNPDGTSVATRVRIASKVEAIGTLAGGGLAYAERFGDAPRLIFLVEEREPRRGDVYSVAEELAYQVEAVEPVDGLTVSALANRLTVTEARRYLAPEV